MKGSVKGSVLMSWFGTSLVPRCHQQHETLAKAMADVARGIKKKEG